MGIGETALPDNIVSFRTLVGFMFITLGMILSVILCLVSISAPCVSNFYNQMPIYPDAELIEQHSSTLNWIAIGNIEYVWGTTDDTETVTAWYQEYLANIEDGIRRARITDDPPPATWQHQYDVISTTNGTEIRMMANCAN